MGLQVVARVVAEQVAALLEPVVNVGLETAMPWSRRRGGP